MVARKRKLAISEQANNEQHKRQQMDPLPSILSKYPFLMPLVVDHLGDKDVLTSLLLTNKEIRGDLQGYCCQGHQCRSLLASSSEVRRGDIAT